MSVENNKTPQSKKPERNKSPQVVQTVVKAPAKGKMTVAQMRELQQKRKEQEKELLEAKAKLKAQEEERVRKAQEEKVKAEEKAVEENKKKKVVDSLRRFSFGPRKPQADNSQKPLVEPVQNPLASVEGTADLAKRRKGPICCVLGHVDTGKTKLLDKLRESDVQGSEAGGITQQIGATFFPGDFLATKYALPPLDMPGVLVIDTPGHESFSNLRSRGSSLCNLAILVVDLLHGLEPQTVESLQLLRDRKTPFVVALNKIDRIYEWRTSSATASFPESLASQPAHVRAEFESLTRGVITQLASHGFNCALWYENSDPRKVVSLVPVSAVTGEGVGALVSLIFNLSGRFMARRMAFSEVAECTILEVKHTEGFGVTLDAIVSNGVLREGDQIGLYGTDGPVFTTVRTLLVPQPLKELRVKSQYVPVKEAAAACGVKIAAHDLETAVPGSRLIVIGESDNASCATEEAARNELEEDMAGATTGACARAGVVVAASTLGSLEALLSFLGREEIPVVATALGRLRRRDVLRASVAPEKTHRVILSFNMKIDSDVMAIAEQHGVQIFSAEIIYHLLTEYRAFTAKVISAGKAKHAADAVFPVALRVVPNCVFNARSPLVLGVEVVSGTLKPQTPLCVFRDGGFSRLGTVTSMKENNKDVDQAGEGVKLAIKIELCKNDTPKMFGRHLDYPDIIYSVVTRESIAVLNEYFSDELTDKSRALLDELEIKFGIV